MWSLVVAHVFNVVITKRLDKQAVDLVIDVRPDNAIGQADVGRGVCLPGTPDMMPNPMGECFEQLAALGVNFDLLAPVSDAVDGAPPDVYHQ